MNWKFAATRYFLGWAAVVAVAFGISYYAFGQAPLIPSDSSSTKAATEASSTGTTGAITATLPAVQGRSTFICGFSYFGTNATGANTATAVTVTGLVNTLSFGYTTLAAGATVPNNPPLTIYFTPCQPASAQNTAIVVNGPAMGAGATFNSVSAWGYTVSTF